MGTYVTIGSQLRFACHAKCITHDRLIYLRILVIAVNFAYYK